MADSMLRRMVTFRHWLGAALVAVTVAAVLYVASPADLLVSLLAASTLVCVAYAVRNPDWPAYVRRASGAGPVAWGTGMLLLSGGVAAAYVTGNPPGMACENAVDDCITLFGYASIAFVGGCFAVVLALGAWGRYRRVAAPATDAVDVGGKQAAVAGRVVPAEGTLRDDDAVARQRVVEEPREMFLGLRGFSDVRFYRPAEQTFEAVPFHVEDGTGRVLVVPDGIDESVVRDWWPETTADGDRAVERPSAAVVAEYFTTDDESRTKEWTLVPGDEVFVAGVANDAGDDHAGDVAFGADGRVVVGATDREKAVESVRKLAVRTTLVGLLFAGGGLAAMLLLA